MKKVHDGGDDDDDNYGSEIIENFRNTDGPENSMIQLNKSASMSEVKHGDAGASNSDLFQCI